MAGPVLAALEKPGPLFAVFSFAFIPDFGNFPQFHFICGSYTCDNLGQYWRKGGKVKEEKKRGPFRGQKVEKKRQGEGAGGRGAWRQEQEQQRL